MPLRLTEPARLLTGYIKNAILMTYSAIICFVATSVFLFTRIYTPFDFTKLAVSAFLVGLLLVFATSLVMMIEVAFAFKVVIIEKESN